MKVRILESNKDKKGAILERIVAIILEKRSYNVTRNEIGAGGNEIDVVAQEFNNRKANFRHTLICECKAHENPINMNDWLKFIVKYYKEKRNNPNTYGLMIALSDANGNVKGDIRESEYEGEFILLTGKDLFAPIQKHYKMTEYDSIQKFVNSWTREIIVDYDIALFEGEPYWLVYFSNNEFTILDKNAEFINSNVLEGMLTLFIESSIYSKDQYIDIRKDKYLELKRTAIETVSIWLLMQGAQTAKTIAEEVIKCSGDTIHPEEYEIITTLDSCDFIKKDGDYYRLMEIGKINNSP